MLQQKTTQKSTAAQGLVEFALVLPVVLLIIMGIIAFAHLIFVYTISVAASREAARYGAAVGNNADGVPYFQDCAGMREAAQRIGRFAGIAENDILIQYEHSASGSLFGDCPTDDIGPGNVNLGDRVVIEITIHYQPLIPLLNLPTYDIISTSRRTVLRGVTVGQAPTLPPFATHTPRYSATPGTSPTKTATPTETETPTKTPTPTWTLILIPTNTPVTPQPTATNTSIFVPTNTAVPNPSATVIPSTPTPSPTPGCIQSGSVTKKENVKLEWTITYQTPGTAVLINLVGITWTQGNQDLSAVSFVPDTGAGFSYTMNISSGTWNADPNWTGTFTSGTVTYTFKKNINQGTYTLRLGSDRAYCSVLGVQYAP